MIRTREILRKQDRFAVFHVDGGEPVRHFERGLERVGDAALYPLFYDKAVNDDLNGVLIVLFERDLFGKIVNDAVDSDSYEAAFYGVFKHFLMFALTASHDGRKDLYARALRQLEDAVDHLVDGLARYLAAADGTVRHADPGKKQTQVVVYLCDGANGRTRVFARRFLVDGYGGRKPLDHIDVGLFHLS